MQRLILVRHGETAKNTVNLVHSFGDTELLTKNGIEQIQRTAQKLKEFGPLKIYSSKEARAVQSAQTLSDVLNIPFETIDGMQERNWGVFSGTSWTEVQKILDPMSLEERYTYTPPEGESWEQFEARLLAALNTIIENNPDQTIVLVSHGGAIRALMPHLLSTSKEESFNHNPDNASLTVFDRKDGIFEQVLVNDTSHLS